MVCAFSFNFRKKGVIINVASGGGAFAVPLLGPYCGTKVMKKLYR
jgi:short-subunit dehydrogenase